MSVRTRRVAGELQRAFGEVIQRDHADVCDGLITVTGVEVSPDLRNARVFVSIIGGKVPHEKAIRHLNDRASAIRGAVGRKVYLRNLPMPMFIYDESGERAERISKLINDWHDEHPADPAPEE